MYTRHNRWDNRLEGRSGKKGIPNRAYRHNVVKEKIEGKESKWAQNKDNAKLSSKCTHKHAFQQ